MCAAVFLPRCHRSVPFRRKLLHRAFARQSHCFQLSRRPRAHFRTRLFRPALPINFCKTTTYEHDPRAVDSCAWENRNLPTSSVRALQPSCEELAAVRRQAKSLRKQPSTAFLLAKLAVFYWLLIHLTVRISAPLPMALRPWAVRLSEGAGDRGISAESLRFPSSASHEHPSSPVQLVDELWKTRHMLEPA